MDNARWQKIEELYNSTVEIPESERLEYLAEECGGDEDLFREVASLLGATKEADGFLSRGGFEIGLQVLADPGQVLQAGQQFGHFTITKLLGRGGMGEVYLAEDNRLKRSVALKVLPMAFGDDYEGARRFIQEAQTASVLNHPNILTIYEVGEIGSRSFIASEYIEGTTLRDLLRSTSLLPSEEVVRIVGQISEALSAAHSASIIHRDIKPENVMIRRDGLVKVLDFGLAKLLPQGIDPVSNEDRVDTTPGVILGTVSYMSPEQVRGKETDARSDVWSLGVVLFEMLTGRPPFDGETSSDKIAGILKSEPDFRSVEPPDISGRLRTVILKALRKAPDDRYQSVEELNRDLRWAVGPAGGYATVSDPNDTDYRQVPTTGKWIAHPSSENLSLRSFRGPAVAGKAIAGTALVAGFFAVALWLIYYPSNNASNTSIKIERVASSGKSFAAVISPDGRLVAHVMFDRGMTSLNVRGLGTNEDSVVVPPAREGIGGLAFSKDSRHLYFQRSGKSTDLYRIPVSGGDVESVAPDVHSPISFSPDGSRFAFVRFLPNDESFLMIRDLKGNEKQVARRERKWRFSDGGPSWSPDGSFIASAVNDERERAVMDVALYPVEGDEPTLIAPENWRDIGQVAWLPDGSGVVGQAVPATGEAYIQIWFFPADGGPASEITKERTEHWGVSVSSDGEKLLTIEWQNRSNIWKIPGGNGERAQPISRNIHANYRAIALAPDGRIVYPSNEDADGNRDLWIMNADGTGETKLTHNQGGNILPCVTSDGRYIIVASNRGDLKTYHIWRINLDGSDPRQLTSGKSERGPFCPPDPSFVYFHTGSPTQGLQVSRIGRVSIDGGDIEILTDYPATRSDISPDGRFIASACIPEQGTKPKICIIPIEGGKPEKVFDLEQLSYLRWRPDGTAVTFIKTIDGVSNFWDQPIDGGPQNQITNFAAEWVQNFHWSRDGDLYCSRGYEIRDPVIITNFR